MIVTCEKCTSRFRLADDRVSEVGAKVRCSKCQHTFTVFKEEELMVVDDVMLVEDSAVMTEPPESLAPAAAGPSAPEPPPAGGAGEWQPDPSSAPKPLPVSVESGPASWQPTPVVPKPPRTTSGESRFGPAEGDATAVVNRADLLARGQRPAQPPEAPTASPAVEEPPTEAPVSFDSVTQPVSPAEIEELKSNPHTVPTVVDNDAVNQAAAAAAAKVKDDDDDHSKHTAVVSRDELFAATAAATAEADVELDGEPNIEADVGPNIEADTEEDDGGFFDASTKEIAVGDVRAIIAAAESEEDVEAAIRARTTGDQPAMMDDDEMTAEVDLGALVMEDEETKEAPDLAGAIAEETGDPFGVGGDLESELFADLPEPEARGTGVDPFEPFDADDIPPEFEYDFGVKPGQPKPKFALVLNYAVALMAIAALLFGVTYFFAGDQLRREVGAPSRLVDLPELDGVQLISMRSVKYPIRNGTKVLVVTGEAENTSDQDQNDVYVVAELRDIRGRLLGSQKAPLGLALGPSELAQINGGDSLGKAYAVRASKQSTAYAPANHTVPYTVVFMKPPRGAGELAHSLKLERGEQVVPAKPEVPAPIDDAESSASLEEDDDKPKKGKRRKGKRRKGKRRKGKRNIED